MFIVKRFAFIIVIFFANFICCKLFIFNKKFVEIIYYFLIFLLKPNFACEKMLQLCYKTMQLISEKED